MASSASCGQFLVCSKALAKFANQTPTSWTLQSTIMNCLQCFPKTSFAALSPTAPSFPSKSTSELAARSSSDVFPPLMLVVIFSRVVQVDSPLLTPHCFSVVLGLINASQKVPDQVQLAETIQELGMLLKETV
eukprot:m.53953 g.53953  ORF g.53953 m.53953 type:complete len:133 (+) comp12423_c0_seq1:1450-1848(+)